MILHGDSLHELKALEADSIDLVCTDPPYGYSFMGKDWDKAVPSVEIWQECLRVLKPGAFCFVMSAPRSDVQNAMISRLMEAGFRLDFTPIYWTYASGFPKAGNVGKLVDKRLGVERDNDFKTTTVRETSNSTSHRGTHKCNNCGKYYGSADANCHCPKSKATSDQAKALDGSYTGFQPKPAVEVIIVAMKPLSEKTYVDQALKNGKGITWLDDCKIPTDSPIATGRNGRGDKATFQASETNDSPQEYQSQGRFPANLLCSDDVLNDGVERKSTGGSGAASLASRKKHFANSGTEEDPTLSGLGGYGDTGSYSRYFDLDKWASTLPFLIVPKASKREKNEGLEGFEVKQSAGGGGLTSPTGEDGHIVVSGAKGTAGKYGSAKAAARNHHPTVKPLKLMSYLITLGSRPGDTVLDPFVGSGTTVIAAEQLNRIGIGIERDPEYVKIAEARLEHEKSKIKQGTLL